jgi:molybdate-binding protein
MQPLQTIKDISHLKVIGDPRRLEILQWLMAGPESLSSLGKKLGDHPAKVRHHLKQLEQEGLVEQTSTRIVRGFVEKYYQATSRAYLFTGVILPVNPYPQNKTILALGSHDLALERLAEQFNRDHGDEIHFICLPVGSLIGLVALCQGLCQITGCHLLDADTGEYNAPYVRHFFPGRPMRMLTLAYREQGFIIPPGNPLGLRRLEDLARPEVQFINRAPGSGTRIWLDQKLHQLGIPSGAVRGYRQEAHTHTQVAAAVARGVASTGIGLQAAARQFQLGFIPLFQERYDLVIPEEETNDPKIQLLIDSFLSGEYRRQIESLGGYDITQTGKERNIQ